MTTSGAPPVERAKEIARRVLGEDYDPLLACRDLVKLRQRLPEVADEIMDTFVVFVPQAEPRVHSSSQFSTRNDGTRSNSRVFAVTSVRSAASACAAIRGAFGPIGAPCTKGPRRPKAQGLRRRREKRLPVARAMQAPQATYPFGPAQSSCRASYRSLG